MLFFKLLSKNRQVKQRVTSNRRYTTFEALELISEFEKMAQDVNESIVLDVIIDRGSERIWKDSITLGKGEGLEYIVYMQKTLDRLYTQVGATIPINLQHVVEELEKEYIEQYQEHESKKVSNQTESSEDTSTSKKSFKLDKRTMGMVAASVVILGGMVIGLQRLSFNASSGDTHTTSVVATVDSSSEASQVELPPLEQFLSEKRFLEALEVYPQEYPLIEREIFYLGADGIPYLEDFLKVKDYDKGHYDLAYLKKDYQRVIGMAQVADTDERLTQLAVAYAKEGHIEEAEKLNERLQVAAIREIIHDVKVAHITALIKSGKVADAQSLRQQVQDERLQTFFTEFDKSQELLQKIHQELSKEELDDATKKNLEAQKQKIDAHIQLLIQKL